MHNRLRVASVVGALVVALVACGNAFAQDKKGAPKVDKAQQAEIAAAAKIVDDAMKGQAAPTDYKYSFISHAMKSRDAKTFLPFLLIFEKGQTLPGSAAFYVRVVGKDGLAQTQKAMAAHEAEVQKAAMAAKLDPENTELAAAEERIRAKAPKVEYAFEDFRPMNLASAKPDSVFIVPSMMGVAPGEYDAYLLVKETQASLKSKKVPAKAGLLKLPITVPSYAGPELSTSALVVAKTTQPLKAAPTDADLARNPYIFGMMAVTPSIDFKFSKSDEFTVLFYIYNSGLDAAGKPDLTVDYSFYQRTGDAEKFFNKTPPLELNAKTLPPVFDAKAGHQLNGGQGLPLASFPEGEYRLEIKIVDKVTGKTTVQNCRFTVTGA
jgi:hypothetical protein